MESDDGSDVCHSRGLQKVTDLTRLPYEVANSSDYFQYYTWFINREYDTDNLLSNESEYVDSYDPHDDYEYDISYMADVRVYPNQTQYFKLNQFLAYSANERKMQTIPRRAHNGRHRRSMFELQT